MQLEADKIQHFLDRFNLSKFNLKELRALDDFQRKSLSATKPFPKTLELTFQAGFNSDVLVTHLEVQLGSKEAFTQLLEIGEIQAGCLTNRGVYAPVLLTTQKQQNSNIIVPALAVTQSLKLSLLLRKDFASLCPEISLKSERGRPASQQNAMRAVNHVVRAINICGYQLSVNPSAAELVPLLNVAQSFRQAGRLDEAAEADILASLSLMAARRFIQASQILRRVSRFYAEKYANNKSAMEFSRIDRSWIREDQRENSQLFSRNFQPGRVLSGGKHLLRAAKIELLLAQAINQPSLLHQKLQAYNRANAYAAGNPKPPLIEGRVDYEETIYNLGPTLLPFLVKMLTDQTEIIKICSLKSIQFFYQNLGCTLAPSLPLILKSLIAIYPSQADLVPTIARHQDTGERNQMSSRSKLILDHINHLLQSLLGLLPSMSRKHLKAVFLETLGAGGQGVRSQLRLYLLRFSERMLQLCGPDIEVDVPYIRQVLALTQGKLPQSQPASKHVAHNLTYFAHRILELLKVKVLGQYKNPATLAPICQWIHQTLISYCENQNLASASQLSHQLDLVLAIYPNCKIPLTYPLEPIIYLLNSAIQQTKMPFDKLLDSLIVLINYGNLFEGSSGIAGQIIERILDRAKSSTLCLKQLRILQRLVQIESSVNVRWLEEFLDCIPHSNHDEIYAVFDLLVERCAQRFEKKLVRRVVETLFHQYTVKGKAHQQSKQRLIACLLKAKQIPLSLLFELCLSQNLQPNPKEYYSKRQPKGENCFDSKQFKLDHELFLQTFNLLLLILGKHQQILPKMSILLQQPLGPLLAPISNILSSHSFKLKGKGLLLIKELLLLATAISTPQIASAKLLLFRTTFSILRPFLNLYRQSKLHYYSLLNLGLAIEMLKHFSQQETKYLEEATHEKPIFGQLCVKQILQCWNSLMFLLQSPWESVRQMISQLLLSCFREGLSSISQQLRMRICGIFRQMMIAGLQSGDYSDRLIACKLLASLLGLAHPQTKDSLVEYLNLHWRSLRGYVQMAISLEDDWNEEVSAICKIINKVCVGKEMREASKGRKKSFCSGLDLSGVLQEEVSVKKRPIDTFQLLVRLDQDFPLEDSFDLPPLTEEAFVQVKLFWKVGGDKVGFFSIHNMPEKDSFAEDEQTYFDPNDQRQSDKDIQASSRSQQEQLQFQDLGIIELDDEEWAEEESEVRITQKLPLKKVYKLSPNLATSNKHRMHGKRLQQGELQQQRIIVDELEGRINYPSPPPVQQQQIIQQPTSFSNYLESSQVQPQQPLPEEARKKDKKQPKKRKGSVR